MKRTKRWLIALIAVILIFCAGMIALNSWKPKYPEQAADGAAWDESWTILGNALGVEDPGEGFALLDNNSILTADDTYLATWASGEPEPYVNADGDDAELYEAQLYLLLVGCKDAENAAIAQSDWIAREEQTYNILEARTETHNGQDYTVMIYEVASESNPYARGATAFATRGKYALTAELTCVDEFTGDAAAILGAFLDGFHYNSNI